MRTSPYLYFFAAIVCIIIGGVASKLDDPKSQSVKTYTLSKNLRIDSNIANVKISKIMTENYYNYDIDIELAATDEVVIANGKDTSYKKFNLDNSTIKLEGNTLHIDLNITEFIGGYFNRVKITLPHRSYNIHYNRMIDSVLVNDKYDEGRVIVRNNLDPIDIDFNGSKSKFTGNFGKLSIWSGNFCNCTTLEAVTAENVDIYGEVLNLTVGKDVKVGNLVVHAPNSSKLTINNLKILNNIKHVPLTESERTRIDDLNISD